ncbi:MAG TPA: Gfo/Idh/MocA family oxidoreductase [Candidatus Nitrosotalea sp.]|nr:Gfo/Idh/MocA family oxidoreductase [Candidatus Nitrosotalea sp.]
MTKAVTVAVIGAGYWGPNVIRTFSELANCQVKWVCELSQGRRTYISDRFPKLRTTDELEKVLADPEVDAVAIVTPVTTHRRLAEMALAAGKHVFVEKPLAGSYADAVAIGTAGQNAGRLVGVGHLFVHHPAVVRMKELVESGRLGQLHYAESARVNLGPPASEVDVLWDLAVHDLAILIALMGRPPARVSATARNFNHRSLVDVAFVTTEFDDGFFSVHHASWLAPTKVRRFFLAGAAGSVTFDDTSDDRKLVSSGPGVDSRIGLRADDVKELFYKADDVVVHTLEHTPPLTRELNLFVDAIRNGTAMAVDAIQGEHVVRTLEAAEMSIADGGRAVSVSEVMGEE